MIQTTRDKLRAPRDSRYWVALLAGVAPFILALLLMSVTKTMIASRDAEWIKYLVCHQDDIIESLVVSSIMVAVFCTLLRNKVVIFVAGFQPVVIQAMFIVTDTSRHIALNFPLAAITVLPLLVLLMALGREIGQANDQDTVRSPMDSEKRDTGT